MSKEEIKLLSELFALQTNVDFSAKHEKKLQINELWFHHRREINRPETLGVSPHNTGTPRITGIQKWSKSHFNRLYVHRCEIFRVQIATPSLETSINISHVRRSRFKAQSCRKLC